MKFDSYSSKQTLLVFDKLGFKCILDNEYVNYLFHPGILEEVFVDKTHEIANEVISKSLCDIKLNEWIFDSLYENLN